MNEQLTFNFEEVSTADDIWQDMLTEAEEKYVPGVPMWWDKRAKSIQYSELFRDMNFMNAGKIKGGSMVNEYTGVNNIPG